ncbi:hypothetical protein ScPMuIL_009319 [Solemya velum]
MATSRGILIKLSLFFCPVFFDDIICECAKNVHTFNIEPLVDKARNDVNEQYAYRYRRDTDVVDVDPKCQKQEEDFLKEIREPEYHLEEKYKFQNETYFSMALAWAGENDGNIIVVTVKEDIFGLFESASNVYRSTNYGRNFTLINEKIQGTVIQKHIGLQRNPHDPKKLYLLGVCNNYHCPLFITEDGGATFSEHVLDFHVGEEIAFHPSPTRAQYSLLSGATTFQNDNSLYITKDNGKTWTEILENVQVFKWGSNENEENTMSVIYATVSNERYISSYLTAVHTLKKTTDWGESWTTILQNVVSFGQQGKFLYASVAKEPGSLKGDRLMKLSTDEGQTWHDAQLPTLTQDRFFSVLDMAEGLVFMHVDNPGDTGHGTLYVSAEKGVIFTESLQRHLFPNFGDTDFYRVKSMRSVYLASQMNPDDSIHTMISYNRGATWQPLPRPEGTPCKDETKACNLQIHGPYSLSRGIAAHEPLSIESAVGIILVHGHVADALQTTKPNVYVTSDGGYTWRKALDGPHHYQIADSGGLLVAISSDTTYPDTVKFSTDEGNCWHEYKYTDEKIVFTGLLTEPGSKSMVISIWGYGEVDRRWVVFNINFKNVIKEKCSSDDYVPWMAHESHRANEGALTRGCLLGKRETYRRLKQDSWCFNDFDYDPNKESNVCTCTREDYECDYGYYKPNMDSCVKNPMFSGPEIDVCLRGHEEKIVTEGYRKIPGDVCVNGFHATGNIIDMDKVCSEDNRVELILELEDEVTDERVSRLGVMSIIVISLVVALLVVVMAAYMIHKFIILKRHKVVYRYSLLNQTEEIDYDNECENALSAKSTVYHESEDEELNSISPVKTPTISKRGESKSKGFHDDSDDDMLG